MSTPVPSPTLVKPRRRWLRFSLLALGTLITLALAVILVSLGVSWYLDREARQNWDAAVAETEASVARWRLHQIEQDREKVADGENSALTIMKIVHEAELIKFAWPQDHYLIFGNLSPTAELNEQQLGIIRDMAKKLSGPLTKARRLKDMPRGRFPIVYSEDALSTSVKDQQDARKLADWLRHQAWLLAHDKRHDAAMENCRAIINIGRAMEDEPLLISVLIRMMMHDQALETMERVLAQGQASEAQLRLMQMLLQEESKNRHLLQAMRGERACSHQLLECIRSGKVHLGDVAMPPEQRGQQCWELSNWLADSRAVRYYPEFLRHMNRSVEIVKLPIHKRDTALQEWQAEVSGTDNVLIKVLSPPMHKLHARDVHSQAMLRSAAAATACERYRLANKGWPATLDVLVQEKLLDAVPLDPVDGQPLRYRRTKDGAVIYSIGLDKTDDKGTIDRSHDPGERGLDIGFRLYNIAKRRLPAIPPPTTQ